MIDLEISDLQLRAHVQAAGPLTRVASKLHDVKASGIENLMSIRIHLVCWLDWCPIEGAGAPTGTYCADI